MKVFLKKIVSMLLTLLAVSFIVFAAFEIIPGDAAVSRLGSNATKELKNRRIIRPTRSAHLLVGWITYYRVKYHIIFKCEFCFSII